MFATPPFAEQELKYTKSSQGRDRSDTLVHYDEIVSLKSRLDAVSRDFVAEIPVDDTITPLPAPSRVPIRVVPVQVKESAPSSKTKSPKDDKHLDKDKHKSKSSDHSDHHDSEKLKKDKKEKKEKDDRLEKLQKTKEKGSHNELKTPPDSSRSS